MTADFQWSLKGVIKGRAPKILMLDYFWLQHGWYEKRYGMNWLSSKVTELFVSDACQVMLIPVDSPVDSRVDSVSAVDKMFEASKSDCPNTVEIEYVSEVDALEHHPLVRATRHIDAQLKELAERKSHATGRWHDAQMERLKKDTPFVVAFREGVDWKVYCDQFRAPQEEQEEQARLRPSSRAAAATEPSPQDARAHLRRACKRAP